MPILRRLTGGPTGWIFHCPGCNEPHWFEDDRWQFNGDMERPTFSPSLLMGSKGMAGPRCHLFVREGKIQFLGDCEHEMAGQTVDMVDGDW